MAARTQDIAQALRYGPKTQQAVRRSQYLSDALQQLSAQGSQNIQGWGELGAKLLANAVLQRANDKAQDATVSALKADREDKVARMLAGLPGAGPTLPPVAPPQAAGAQPPPQPALNVDPATAPTQDRIPPPAPVEQKPLPAATPQFAPEDRDALVRMIATEAIGEGPEGMAAAGHVALNRLRTGYGGAKSLRDVVFAPHQFEGMSRANEVKPEDYARAQQVADAILTGQAPDPTGGAVNFLNPELQLQLGRQIPAWAQGEGKRIGRHVFFGGQGQPEVQMAAAPAGAPPANIQQQFPSGSFQLASTEMQPGMIPQQSSAPGSSPSVAGTGPAAPPQAPAAGPTTYQPTPQEVSLVRRLLTSSDPTEQAYGEKLYYELLEKATQPVEWQNTTINGLPAQVHPTTGQVRMLGLPQEARTRVVSAQEAGIAAPPGTWVSISPTGEFKIVDKPPAGQMVVSGPGQQYREAPVSGGTLDPTSPANIIQGEGRLRDDYEKLIKDFAAAREGYQKVVQAAKTGTPAGDIALVFGYMKTLDPGSTVREGEAATIQNSGTIPQTVQNMYNKLLTGDGRLLPEQRAQFAASAEQQFQVYQRSADALNRRYEELARSYGFNPERVIRRFDPIAPFRPATQPPAGAPPAPQGVPQPVADAYNRRVKQGLINPQKPAGDQANPLIARSADELRRFDVPANRGKWVITPSGDLGVID